MICLGGFLGSKHTHAKTHLPRLLSYVYEIDPLPPECFPCLLRRDYLKARVCAQKLPSWDSRYCRVPRHQRKVFLVQCIAHIARSRISVNCRFLNFKGIVFGTTWVVASTINMNSLGTLKSSVKIFVHNCVVNCRSFFSSGFLLPKIWSHRSFASFRFPRSFKDKPSTCADFHP